jgi:hypothetical protein
MNKHKAGRFFPVRNVFSMALIGAIYMTLFSAPAAVAQDKDDDSSAQKTISTQDTSPTDGLNLNLGRLGVDNSLTSSNLTFDNVTTGLSGLSLPGEAVGSTLFKLDIASPDCLTGEGQCLRRNDQINAGVSTSFSSLSQSGLDFTLTPRANLRFDDDGKSALVGAVIEIGEDLRQGSEFKNNTWYFFAGADAEALTYSPSSVKRLTSGQFHLQDRIIVGDAQAGLGYRMGDTDVSLSYMRREASAEDFSFTEDAAALSFTWKR